MIRKLSTWLLVAMVGGVLIAGCGSSSSSSSSSSPTTSAPAATTKSSSSGSESGGSSSNPTLAAAVAKCKQGVQAAATLSSSTKGKLEQICDKAANGNPDAARKAAREVCVEIVNASPLPAGAAKEQALASCKGSK